MVRAMTPPPTDAEIQLLRRRLLKKGAEINEKLVALLNGQTVNVEALLKGGKTKPGQSPIERLRHFMSLIDGRLRAIKEGRYGRCEICGDGLPFAHLEQIPWIDTCQACAAKPPDATT